ncbi:hypothetical protein BZG36_03116 [Bifiguratus adelaidae]|uniref:FCH domain-containing protein n=1 Tax=Bifiguratus adelaidae TaxID=1938954 RepID=A0A261Y0Q5_9FUNG|nr:hypothetical protein BZG36_03116 [Bifiguratus adelaidae]
MDDKEEEGEWQKLWHQVQEHVLARCTIEQQYGAQLMEMKDMPALKQKWCQAATIGNLLNKIQTFTQSTGELHTNVSNCLEAVIKESIRQLAKELTATYVLLDESMQPLRQAIEDVNFKEDAEIYSKEQASETTTHHIPSLSNGNTTKDTLQPEIVSMAAINSPSYLMIASPDEYFGGRAEGHALLSSTLSIHNIICTGCGQRSSVAIKTPPHSRLIPSVSVIGSLDAAPVLIDQNVNKPKTAPVDKPKSPLKSNYVNDALRAKTAIQPPDEQGAGGKSDHPLVHTITPMSNSTDRSSTASTPNGSLSPFLQRAAHVIEEQSRARVLSQLRVKAGHHVSIVDPPETFERREPRRHPQSANRLSSSPMEPLLTFEPHVETKTLEDLRPPARGDTSDSSDRQPRQSKSMPRHTETPKSKRHSTFFKKTEKPKNLREVDTPSNTRDFKRFFIKNRDKEMVTVPYSCLKPPKMERGQRSDLM